MLADGFEVVCAADGRQALELLASHNFSLVILDLHMDGLDGLSVLRELRRVWPLMQLPVLMVSANHEAPPMVEALEAGASDYLTKPVAPALLKAKINRHLAQAVPRPSLRPDTALTPGSRAGHYEILSLLGEGNMGRVYRARDVRLLRQVALKVMARCETDEQLERFGREALAVARISHPNVVTIYDIGDTPVPFLAMELLQGKSLDQFPMPLDIAQAVDWTVAILDALAAVHACGLIHRDLKPENIMISEAGHLKLMDFGVAQFAEQEIADCIEGSPQYMAPEQIDRSFGSVSPATDLFSVGGVLYTMLTGSPPFPTAVPGQQFFTIVFGTPRPPTEINPALSEELQSICLRALEKEPARRFASAEEFARALRSARPAPS